MQDSKPAWCRPAGWAPCQQQTRSVPVHTWMVSAAPLPHVYAGLTPACWQVQTSRLLSLINFQLHF
jgi:hypothetical protein